MGRERQKKKNRSSINKAKLKSNGRTKAGKKKVNMLGNPIIAQNWDRKLTMTQNYNRLGLSARLNAPTGGSENASRKIEEVENAPSASDSLYMTKNRKTSKLIPSETKVERDPETGRIVRVIQADSQKQKQKRPNPLNDPLAELSEDDDEGEPTRKSHGIVAELQAQAAAEADVLERTRRPRQQSKQEIEWIQKLVDKHGDNVTAMARDMKLNPMQQSQGDLKRRLQVWRSRKTQEV